MQRHNGCRPWRPQRVAVPGSHGDAVVASGHIQALERYVGAALNVNPVPVWPFPWRDDVQTTHYDITRAAEEGRPVGAEEQLEAIEDCAPRENVLFRSFRGLVLRLACLATHIHHESQRCRGF